MKTIKQTINANQIDNTIYKTCTDDHYVFDAETENKLKELGFISTDLPGQYRNEDLTIYISAQENNKYYLDIECIKRINETFEEFLIKQNQLTALAIKINEIMK